MRSAIKNLTEPANSIDKPLLIFVLRCLQQLRCFQTEREGTTVLRNWISFFLKKLRFSWFSLLKLGWVGLGWVVPFIPKILNTATHT